MGIGSDTDARKPGGPFALLLDFDGTLTDTVAPLARIYADFVTRIGAGDGAPDFSEANGMDLGKLVVDLARRFAPHQDPEDIWRGYRDDVTHAILEARPSPGLRPLLDWARGCDWKIGIASSGRSDVIRRWLHQHNLAPYIDDIVGADMTPRAKPYPDLYIELMERLGVTGRNSIAIEDSRSGAMAAHTAGVDVILLAGEQDKASPGEDATVQFCYIARDLSAATEYLRRRQDGPVPR